MFARIARGIVKHHKAIVAFWIVILVISLFALPYVADVIVYEETGFAPGYVESQKAQKIIDEQFPTSLANSTIIIVVETDDIESTDVRDFTLEVEEGIANNPEITYVENLTSVYSIYRFVFVQAAGGLQPQIPVVEGAMDGFAYMFFSGPNNYSQEWDDTPVNYTVFNDSWNTYNSSLPDDPQLKSTLYFYSLSFWQNWTDSFNVSSDIYLSGNPHYLVRGQHVLSNLTEDFFGLSPPMTDEQFLMNATFAGLNITTWKDPFIFHLVFLNVLGGMSGLPVTFVDGLYQLGMNPTDAEIQQFAQDQLIGLGTVSSYPIALPPGSLEFLMNTTTDTMLITIDFSIDAGFTDDSGEAPMVRNVDQIRREVMVAKEALNAEYIRTWVTGDVALGSDIERAAFEDVEKIDPVTIALVFVIIGVFFMSFVTPGVAVGGIGMAVVISQSVIVLVGTYVAQVHFSVLTLMLTAMLGAGTDYAIFLMARYREERLRGRTKEESVQESVTWAGESITTSGLAVMISFGALSLGSFDLVRTMGITIMIGIGIALLVALTFIPSLLMLVGDKIFWPGYKKWEEKSKKEAGAYTRYFRRSARIAVKYAKPITVAAILISIPAVYAVFTLETSFDFLAAMPPTEATEGIEAMGRGFGEGRLAPTYVVVESPTALRYLDSGNETYDIAMLGSIENLSAEMAAVEAVQQVIGPTRPRGVPIDYTQLNNASYRESFDSTIDSTFGEDNRTVLLSVIMKEESFTPESVGTVQVLRDIASDTKEADSNLANANILVGGASASIKDIKDVLDRDFSIMAVVVIIADFILLMFVLGSVLVPLRLILTILLSISWTLAMTLLIFQVWLSVPVLWLMPWVLFVIAMGLGMDYDIFLTTRIREEVAKGKTDKEAIVTAVEKTGGIITAAGVVMAGAFATMMLSSLGLLQEFGFALAFVILLDAMIVRIYLVPSVMILLEKWNWWAPGRLQRVRREEKMKKRKR